MTISGDLGQRGHVRELIELVAPHYDAGRHGPRDRAQPAASLPRCPQHRGRAARARHPFLAQPAGA
ncbi:MAG: hypothetical protein WDM96_15025 [Lacunisphaera sp.]